GLKASPEKKNTAPAGLSVKPLEESSASCEQNDQEQTIELKIPKQVFKDKKEKENREKVQETPRKTAPARERQFVQPSLEVINSIRTDLAEMLQLMGFPSAVDIQVTDNMVECVITGEHENELVGEEGRILDSLQYLLRKMVNQKLPERMPLALDAGNFREQRINHLREQAIEFAEQVRENGKTKAIPALNPSERRVVHMVLQDDKSVRSRSVGEGLFKKVLIYKPGKSRTSRLGSRRRRGGRQGGDSSDR
ncbi:MAG: hypothetical protein OEV64_08760, partial [Desulfobulbaceae bacterium]|nr:hypothetical protein [Desulfobulbaceae bacterium]